jgi:hypothetical protein
VFGPQRELDLFTGLPTLRYVVFKHAAQGPVRVAEKNHPMRRMRVHNWRSCTRVPSSILGAGRRSPRVRHPLAQYAGDGARSPARLPLAA